MLYGIHFAEIVYHMGDDGEPVEHHRERIAPTHVKFDDGRSYMAMGDGNRIYFDGMPGKWIVERR